LLLAVQGIEATLSTPTGETKDQNAAGGDRSCVNQPQAYELERDAMIGDGMLAHYAVPRVTLTFTIPTLPHAKSG
jgi:hypothetical protein